jgi:hypothetical protein
VLRDKNTDWARTQGVSETITEGGGDSRRHLGSLTMGQKEAAQHGELSLPVKWDPLCCQHAENSDSPRPQKGNAQRMARLEGVATGANGRGSLIPPSALQCMAVWVLGQLDIRPNPWTDYRALLLSWDLGTTPLAAGPPDATALDTCRSSPWPSV